MSLEWFRNEVLPGVRMRIRQGLILVIISTCSLWPIATLYVHAQPSANDRQRISDAERLIHNGEFDKGISILKPLIQSDDHNPRLLNLMGIAVTGRGDLKEADRWFNAVLRLDPSFVPSLKNLAINEFNLNHLSKSQELLDRAASIAPDDPVVQLYLGHIAYSRHKYESSKAHLSSSGRILETQPNAIPELIDSYLKTNNKKSAVDLVRNSQIGAMPAATQFRVAFILADFGLFKEASPIFKSVMRLAPSSYDAAFDLAICSYQLDNFARAIEILENLKTTNHNSAELEILLADALERAGRTDRAVTELKEATILEPKNQDAYLDLADICVNHNSPELGMEIINVGLRNIADSSRLLFARGVLHAMNDQTELAASDFEAARKLTPDASYSYAGLALNYFRSGNVKPAIELLRARISATPNDFMLQYMLGRALMQAGADVGAKEFVEAQTAFEKSVELNPKFHASRVELGETYLSEKRFGDAVLELEKAHQLDPKDRAACAQLFIAYRKLGRTREADQVLAELKKLNSDQRTPSQNGVRLVKRN